MVLCLSHIFIIFFDSQHIIVAADFDSLTYLKNLITPEADAFENCNLYASIN